MKSDLLKCMCIRDLQLNYSNESIFIKKGDICTYFIDINSSFPINIIVSEYSLEYYPLLVMTFNDHFIDMDEWRDYQIDIILNK